MAPENVKQHINYFVSEEQAERFFDLKPFLNH
jgi:hypothetical protein